MTVQHREDNNRNHQYLMIKFPGPDKTCVEQNYIITVFNISMMNTTDDGHVKLSAPKVFFPFIVVTCNVQKE